jgi:methylase of polypeptide subunit release factors
MRRALLRALPAKPLVNEGDGALADLLRRLKALGYDFVTVTPSTHARILARPDKKRAHDLRDIFGWSLPFDRETLPADLFALLERAGAVERAEGGHRSRLRVSRVGAHLFLHSSYPTDGRDAVFLGPDTSRFVRFVAAELGRRAGRVARLVDMGAGSGAGAICAAALLPGARLTLVDSNPEALRLARINARAAGVAVETVEAGSVEAVEGGFDLLIANPPYLMDEGSRAYRDGGGMNGAALALEWALAGARRGDVFLYTGAAIVAGADALRAALETAMPALGRTLRYEELDPDIFGEELEAPAYRGIERIAAIGAVIAKP